VKRYIAIVPLLLALIGGASAQNLIVNNGQCVIPLRLSTTATIDPSTGDVRISTDDANPCGGGTIPPGPSVSLVVNPTVVASSGQFTVSWNVAPAATSTCTTSGGAGTTWTQLSSGTFQQNQGVGSQTYALANTGSSAVAVSFTLSCTFTEGTVPPRTATVTVNSQNQPPVGCDGVTPPNENIEIPFAGIFGTTNNPLFPGQNGTFLFREISRNTNISVRFVARAPSSGANAMPTTGAFDILSQKGAGISIAPTSVSLKSCKGDYRNLGDGCNGVVNGNTNTVPFTAIGTPGFCSLVAGQTYYINIIHGTPPNLSVPTCADPSCLVAYIRRK